MALDNATVRFKQLATNMFWSRLSPHFPLHNLSKSGLAFSTTFPVKKGTKILMKICFDGGECFELKGIVKWLLATPGSQQYRVGVQFLPFGTHKEYNDLETLKFLRKLLPNNSRFSNEQVADSAN